MGIALSARIVDGDGQIQIRFASLCGVAPLPASAGKTERHRLSRGGDRQANRALYRIAVTGMPCDRRTEDCVEKRGRDGKSKKGAVGCLKRYVAREVFRALRRPPGIKGLHGRICARPGKLRASLRSRWARP